MAARDPELRKRIARSGGRASYVRHGGHTMTAPTRGKLRDSFDSDDAYRAHMREIGARGGQINRMRLALRDLEESSSRAEALLSKTIGAALERLYCMAVMSVFDHKLWRQSPEEVRALDELVCLFEEKMPSNPTVAALRLFQDDYLDFWRRYGAALVPQLDDVDQRVRRP